MILDGHDSHKSYDFITFCEQHGIILLCLPPHSTHLVQPLDVGVFSPLKTAYCNEIDVLSRARRDNINKKTFLQIYIHIRPDVFNTRIIRSAWAAAGITPLNKDRVLQSLPNHQRQETLPSFEFHGVENEDLYYLGNSSPILPQTDYQIGRHIHHASFASPRKARRCIKQLAEIARQRGARSGFLEQENEQLKRQLAGKAEEDKKPGARKERSIESRARVLTAADVIKKRAADDAAEAEKEQKKRARIEAKDNKLNAANEAEIDKGIRLMDAQLTREENALAKAEAAEARKQKRLNKVLSQRPRTPSLLPIDPALQSSPPYPTEELSRHLLQKGPEEDDLPYRITAPISPPPFPRNPQADLYRSMTWREAVEEGSVEHYIYSDTEVATDNEAEAVE